MELPLSIFINGMLGVFAGMAVLYLAIKVIALCAGSPPQEKQQQGEQ